MADDVLERLTALIAARRDADVGTSYTRELLDGGVERCARKFGEEAVETMIAALVGDARALEREAADVLYHLLVLLECRQVALTRVLAELGARLNTSGLAEKAQRGRTPA
jgi:phosphoribosyl-ATP pyrophosphohydrolase